MFIALNETFERVHIDDAVRKRKYYCQNCGCPVIYRKGGKRIPHFAHKRNTLRNHCDSWKHDKSDWHKSLQNLFPMDCQEVVMKNEDGVCHIADIFTNDKVIEFQHSPMSIEEFNKRNTFYKSLGKKIIWLFDVRSASKDDRLDNHLSLKKEIQAINGFDPSDENVWMFIQTSGSDIASLGDDNSEIVRLIDRDEMGFKTDVPISLKEFVSVVQNDIEYEELIKEKEHKEKLLHGRTLRRIMGQTLLSHIIALNLDTGVEARVYNSDEIFNSEKITGQVRIPGRSTFSKKIYPIHGQNDPVWIQLA